MEALEWKVRNRNWYILRWGNRGIGREVCVTQPHSQYVIEPIPDPVAHSPHAKGLPFVITAYLFPTTYAVDLELRFELCGSVEKKICI